MRKIKALARARKVESFLTKKIAETEIVETINFRKISYKKEKKIMKIIKQK